MNVRLVEDVPCGVALGALVQWLWLAVAVALPVCKYTTHTPPFTDWDDIHVFVPLLFGFCFRACVLCFQCCLGCFQRLPAAAAVAL